MQRSRLSVGVTYATEAASTSSRQPAEVDVVQLSDSDEDEPMALAVTRPASASSAPETTEPVATTSTWGSRTSLYDFMRSAATPEAPQKSPIAKELATFLLEPALQQDADPLAFWSARRAVYPHLEVAAKNALAVPASSGPSERVFSMSGKMFSPARSRLSGDLAESMMHVKCE
ncbi:putative AC9 transposase [Amphibalanus amphitrite]|uniref:Putative AC9 transposase n=1 Tax=Amphibalanus amphitrite TaxID=1232801 RepID=A0A6A4VWU0_AMPAM|nr:putative AC9 transposase [Amphibalanus amphitrite]